MMHDNLNPFDGLEREFERRAEPGYGFISETSRAELDTWTEAAALVRETRDNMEKLVNAAIIKAALEWQRTGGSDVPQNLVALMQCHVADLFGKSEARDAMEPIPDPQLAGWIAGFDAAWTHPNRPGVGHGMREKVKEYQDATYRLHAMERDAGDGWRTLDDCPSDGRWVWTFSSHAPDLGVTLRPAEGGRWRIYAAQIGKARPRLEPFTHCLVAYTHWKPAHVPTPPGVDGEAAACP